MHGARDAVDFVAMELGMLGCGAKGAWTWGGQLPKGWGALRHGWDGAMGWDAFFTYTANVAGCLEGTPFSKAA
jgi:hypothetical protein